MPKRRGTATITIASACYSPVVESVLGLGFVNKKDKPPPPQKDLLTNTSLVGTAPPPILPTLCIVAAVLPALWPVPPPHTNKHANGTNYEPDTTTCNKDAFKTKCVLQTCAYARTNLHIHPYLYAYIYIYI